MDSRVTNVSVAGVAGTEVAAEETLELSGREPAQLEDFIGSAMWSRVRRLSEEEGSHWIHPGYPAMRPGSWSPSDKLRGRLISVRKFLFEQVTGGAVTRFEAVAVRRECGRVDCVAPAHAVVMPRGQAQIWMNVMTGRLEGGGGLVETDQQYARRLRSGGGVISSGGEFRRQLDGLSEDRLRAKEDGLSEDELSIIRGSVYWRLSREHEGSWANSYAEYPESDPSWEPLLRREWVRAVEDGRVATRRAEYEAYDREQAERAASLPAAEEDDLEAFLAKDLD